MLYGCCHSTFVSGLSAHVQASSNTALWLLTACPLGQDMDPSLSHHALLGSILSRSSSMARMCPCLLALLSCAERHMVSEGGHDPRGSAWGPERQVLLDGKQSPRFPGFSVTSHASCL